MALLTAAGLLVLGVSLPSLSVNQLLLFEERLSVLTGLRILWTEGEWGLAGVVVVFSLVLPVVKIGTTGWLWYGATPCSPGFRVAVRLVDLAGKWSMLDVFVVALVVVSVKVSLVTAVAVHPGLYLFASAVVLSMICAQRVRRIAENRCES